MSITLFESMALKVPVVVTAVGGNLELIEDGTSGVLAGIDDPDSLPMRF